MRNIESKILLITLERGRNANLQQLDEGGSHSGIELLGTECVMIILTEASK
jgi:hypothetical protein